MKTFKSIILLIFVLFFLVACGDKGTIHIYAAMGQSNMVGQGGVNKVLRPVTDRLMYLDLTDQLQVIEDTLYSEESNYWCIQNLDRYSAPIAFADRIQGEFPVDDKIVIIPLACGNTKIQWQLNCWEVYVKRIRYVLNNYNAVFEGIIFWQGESNIHNPEEWKTGMLDLLDKIENEFGEVEFVFAQLGNNLTEDEDYMDMWENFKIEQQNFSIENNIKMIYTEDLPLYDHLHVSTVGLEIAGVRFAEKFLEKEIRRLK